MFQSYRDSGSIRANGVNEKDRNKVKEKKDLHRIFCHFTFNFRKVPMKGFPHPHPVRRRPRVRVARRFCEHKMLHTYTYNTSSVESNRFDFQHCDQISRVSLFSETVFPYRRKVLLYVPVPVFTCTVVRMYTKRLVQKPKQTRAHPRSSYSIKYILHTYVRYV